MTPIELRAKVGPDGVLTLSVPMGISEANTEVRVVVEPAVQKTSGMTQEEWHRFIAETAGSIDDPTFERPEQGEYEQRDPWP
jgi:hypothetical protein